MKPKPGQIALDAIDASLVEAESLMWPIKKQAIAELRAWRRVIVEAGKVHVFENGKWRQGDPREALVAIYKARVVEARRKP